MTALVAGMRRFGVVLPVHADFDVATDVPWADLENRVMRAATVWTPMEFVGEADGSVADGFEPGTRLLQFACMAVPR